MAKNMSNVGAGARRRNRAQAQAATAAAADAQAAAGAGVVVQPVANPEYQPPTIREPLQPTGDNQNLSPRLAAALARTENIKLSDADRRVMPMNPNETMRAVIPPADRQRGGDPAATIGRMVGANPLIVRNERGDVVGVVVRTRLTGKGGINKTLITLTPRDEYRMTHYTRRGREVSRQEGFDPNDMARIYRDTTGIALGFGRI